MKVGILGGGQLAQMMAISGKACGHEFMFLSDDPLACAGSYGHLLSASYDDTDAQDRLAEWADVVTYEFENVPLATARHLEERTTLHPSAAALSVASDRLKEKSLFQSLGVATAEFRPVDSLEQLNDAFASLGQAAILKTRTQGYDGKGQNVLTRPEQLKTAWDSVGKVPCIVESKVPFCREISIIAARSQGGELHYYPVSENYHREGILRLAICRNDDPCQAQAENLIKSIMDHLDYVGVLTLELFQVNDQLIANEIAPRVHNTGHWTIEGSLTSQFDNHLRAVCRQPLGETRTTHRTAMVNLIGSIPPQDAISAIPSAVLHTYGKADRPGRKVGHITLVCDEQSPAADFGIHLKSLLNLAGENDLAGRNYSVTV